MGLFGTINLGMLQQGFKIFKKGSILELSWLVNLCPLFWAGPEGEGYFSSDGGNKQEHQGIKLSSFYSIMAPVFLGCSFS